MSQIRWFSRAPRTLCVGFLFAAFALCAGAQTVSSDLYAGMRWRSIGPYRSGNVYAVAGVNEDPTVYYLGLPEGGVWKTTDGGTVWKPIFDQMAVPSIGSVAVATSNPQVVYAGTGDNTSWSFTPGKGVFKSTDAGATWKPAGLADTRYLPVLLVDPQNPDVVLAAAQAGRGGGGATGVYRTTDGGATWTRTLFISDRGGIADMTWDVSQPKTVYATIQGAGAGGRGGAAAPAAVIYKSTDEGATWQPLTPQGLPDRLTTVTIAAGDGGQRVYVMLGGGAGGRARGVYRSDDGGQHWSLGTEQIGSAGGRIYVDPKNPDTVYLMGTSLYRSLDGAHTFVSFKGAPGGDDYRALWVDPAHPERMLAGVDQGPSITVDGGQTWTPWYNLPNGQFYDVFTDNQNPYWVYGAQQDSGTAGVRSRSDYGDIRIRDWYPVGGFEAGYIAVDPLNPRWVYTQGWYHVMRVFDRETGQVSVVYTPTPADRFGSMPPTVFSPENPHRLYLGAQYVLASDDAGRTWRHLGGDLTVRPEPAAAPAAGAGGFAARPRPAAIQSLAPSPISAQVIWAGTSNGRIQVTQDGGQTWKNVSPPELTARSAVNHIDASHHNPGTAYAAVEDGGSSHPYLYRTTDYGHTWTAIVTGLPEDVKTRVVREDPEDPSLLYAGTEMGAWVSFDRGNHWQPLQLNLPHTVVSDMQVHGDDLVISTYGRSFWILDDVTPLRQQQQAAAAADAYLYKPETGWRIRWSNNHDTPLPPEVPAGENPPEGAILDYYLKTPAQGAITLGIYDSAGRLIQQYSNTPPPPVTSPPNVPTYWFPKPIVLSTAPGMHRIAWDERFPTPKALTYSYYGGLLDYTEYTLTWHAVRGETPQVQPVGPIVIPGTYQVRLTVNGHTYRQPLTLKNDTRSAATQADLEAQLATEKQVMAGLETSYNAYQQLTALEKALGAETAPADPAYGAAAAKLEKELGVLTGGTSARGFGIANRELARRLQDLEFGDYRPTASDIASVEESCSTITQATAEFEQIESRTVPALNHMMGNGSPLPIVKPATGPACGR